ncbi:unnamed protein product, partial [Symbiodinium necroappetens]
LLAPPKPDTIGRSLFAKPKSGHSKEPFRESIQQGSRPASTRGKTSAKDSEESDEESQASEAESKASKASNSKASKKGKDAEDAAGGTIEVKDPETLWKVNIEAVYRRKNPKLLSKVPDFIAKYKAPQILSALRIASPSPRHGRKRKRCTRVFQGLGQLSDDDVTVCLRAAGVETSRRVLGLRHSALMGLDGHYRARIMARDAILAQHHPAAAPQQTPPSKPMPTVGPTSKQASKGTGKTAPQPAQQPGTPSTSTTPPPATTRPTATSASAGAGPGGTTAGKATVPKKTPPAKPTAAAAPAAPPGTVKPGVVAHIGKRPPVVPSAPFEDSTAQDVELMVDRPVGTAKAPSPSPPPPAASLAYLDLIVPDLEDHMLQAPTTKALPPVPESPMSSEHAEEEQGRLDGDSDSDDDEPVAVEPWPRDEEDDGTPAQPALATPAAPRETATDTDAGATQETGGEEQPAASSADLPQTASAGDPDDAPLPPPKFPLPDVVERERRRAERRARERAEREAERAEREAAERATLDAWAGYPDPCNVLQNETNSIWTLPPGVPPQPAPSRHADAHVQGYCNLGCETPKRLRTNVCLGRCYRPIIQTRAGTVHKHHFCSPCDRTRTARDR